ncbi:MAG TPA: helix-turn-helix domain-containing protein [Gemmatimonadales bacterium]|nr:helix-turn-helix domain-containing protein [Gemmatimonadales bacterium]
MQQRIDLTRFGFTPTESLVYEVLLTSGPGTGYAIARSARLARANAYSALEGLVAKGAARVEGSRPKIYRPEAPAGLIARITQNHALALERLSNELDQISIPSTPTVVEIDSSRGVLQLINHDVARASESVSLLAPPDAFPLLAPALRRPVAAGIPMGLWSTSPVDLGFVPVKVIETEYRWPGMPILVLTDDRNAIIGARDGSRVTGHWSTAPTFVAAVRLALERLKGTE